jgi:two-component system, OmpR family, sensor histidine kinase KdpD
MSRAGTRAEDFLALVERSQRGRLKLYLGFAAGVGKTYRMLEEAHALRLRGVDLVVGFVESHGRAETAALVEGLEVVPRRRVEYRGVTIEELDLDAVLQRRPTIAVVDELAHTNEPGARNRKRYQDVLELLAAGINVIGAFNVQHLQSLNDIVSRSAQVRVRETLPDRFVKEADQIVNVDLAVEDLLQRLESGKIYPLAEVAAARAHFFGEANLSALRELSLREVAESLERTAQARRPLGQEHRSPVGGRVMVCMSSYPPHAATLLRRGSRMAGRLSTDWFVVYVETPRESPTRIDAETQRHLQENIDAARELGAEVVRLQGRDAVDSLLDFARSHGVGHLVLGRSHQSWWWQLLGRSVPLRLVREAGGFDLHIVSFPDDDGGEPESGETRAP